MLLQESINELLLRFNKLNNVLEEKDRNIINYYIDILKTNPSINELYSMLLKFKGDCRNEDDNKGKIIKILNKKGNKIFKNLYKYSNEVFWNLHESRKKWYVSNCNGQLMITNDPNPTIILMNSYDNYKYPYEFHGSKYECMLYLEEKGYSTADFDIL